MARESESSADQLNRAFRIPDRIPIFPLPNVVFFPRTYLPLHIFEPRYRRMVADAVAGHQCIGMALLKDGWEEHYYGNPPVFDIGCVGRLASVQPLPDGRYNILLQGLERFDIRQHYAEHPYREAYIRLRVPPPDDAVSPPARGELVRLTQAYLQAREDGRGWRHLVETAINDDVLVNGLSTYLDWTPLEKQLLLEADTLEQRARRLIDLLRFTLAGREGSKGVN
jgi:Lon protease-like protein